MNIYLHEFKANFKSILTWVFSIMALIILFMALFSSIASEAEAINIVMANYPPELLRAFGMDNMDMATPMGYFGLIFLFVQICVAVQAANYGISLISIEERDLTADFLLAKPVSRVKILTTKLLAALSSLLVVNLVIWICSYIALNQFIGDRTFDTATLVRLLGTITFLQLFFLVVGLFLSLLLKKVRSVIPISMGLVFSLYILNAFGGSFGTDLFTYLTPFRWFEAQSIIQNGAYEMPLVLISVAVTLLALIGSYWLYQKRDVHSV
jgi:ABC-2 type transport system permease protein